MYKYNAMLLRKAKRHINSGGVIAYPTESCYGFGCDPFNYKAVAKIIKLKGRFKAKGLIVIAGRIEQLKNLTVPFALEDKVSIGKYWPGPYSLILPAMPNIPRNLTGSHSKVAVRVTKHVLVRQLCNYLNSPLVSTSANKSGRKSIKTYRECSRLFGNKVLVLPGCTNFAKRPSTVIDWETKEIIRR